MHMVLAMLLVTLVPHMPITPLMPCMPTCFALSNRGSQATGRHCLLIPRLPLVA
jgi:hypothetical protein